MKNITKDYKEQSNKITALVVLKMEQRNETALQATNGCVKRFPLHSKCSLAVLYPLFPCAPSVSMVKDVVSRSDSSQDVEQTSMASNTIIT